MAHSMRCVNAALQRVAEAERLMEESRVSNAVAQNAFKGLNCVLGVIRENARQTAKEECKAKKAANLSRRRQKYAANSVREYVAAQMVLKGMARDASDPFARTKVQPPNFVKQATKKKQPLKRQP